MGIQAILVTFPRSMGPDTTKELTARKRDVKNLNKNFQVAAALGWIDFSSGIQTSPEEAPAFIKILTEERQDLIIRAGRYNYDFVNCSSSFISTDADSGISLYFILEGCDPEEDYI